jgi:hypothetical protein
MRIGMNERQQNYMKWHREKFLNKKRKDFLGQPRNGLMVYKGRKYHADCFT